MTQHTAPAPLLVTVTRDGVVESEHRGDVVVCDVDGRVLAAAGSPDREVYARSALKPFQALATLDQLDAAGLPLTPEGLAIACASHAGGDDHQIEAAHLLALAGLDEEALRCPPEAPADPSTARHDPTPTRLAHNCSGKHASFLLAEVAAGRGPGQYLNPEGPLQVAIREQIAAVCGAPPQGPGIDGCGAPAWRVPLAGLATAFARLSAGADARLERIRAAMTAHPGLVGGQELPDTRLMRGDARIVAKRGAEAVFAAGARTTAGSVGIAVKIADGGARAAPPVVAELLEGLGLDVAEPLRAPAVLGGGLPHGRIAATGAVKGLVPLG